MERRQNRRREEEVHGGEKGEQARDKKTRKRAK